TSCPPRRSSYLLFLGLDHFRGIGRRQRRLGAREVLVHVDAVALESREQVVDFLGGMHFRWQDIVHLIVEQVAALLAHVDELPYLIVFFLDGQRHASSPGRGRVNLRREQTTMLRRNPRVWDT